MKKAVLFLVCVGCAVAVYFTVNANSQHASSPDLMSQNIEALTAGETSTTWNCVNNTGNCSASCGQCGTSVSGKGDLTGTHRCN
jgi:hypothetical protein